MQQSTNCQNADVLNHLIQRFTITPDQARKDYGIDRLAARVKNLRDRGVEIETVPLRYINRNGHVVRYAMYKLQSRAIPAAAMPYIDEHSKIWINEAEN